MQQQRFRREYHCIWFGLILKQGRRNSRTRQNAALSVTRLASVTQLMPLEIRVCDAVTHVTLFSGNGGRLTPGNLLLHPAGVEQLFPVFPERDIGPFKVVGKATEDNAFRNRAT